ncbi:oxidoreductase [Liquorilactobacillus vini DSM 20605]|uniref:Oxidoreductase n=1 Tax=Liquorilactobacillus vini DSM 20605 TaxID=1133569 RepID=A0A0R2C0Z6_9LACO|nr:oxidoreductase [Liquorilactobacillus vini DSM 20605]
MTLAIIGGKPERFLPYVKLYQKATEQFATRLHPLAIHSHGVIARTDEEAFTLAWKYLRQSFVKLGHERGWTPMSAAQFKFEIEAGSFYVGSPQTVAKRLATTISQLGAGRFELVYGAGGLPARERLKMIELYATQVVPQVRELLMEGQRQK